MSLIPHGDVGQHTITRTKIPERRDVPIAKQKKGQDERSEHYCVMHATMQRNETAGNRFIPSVTLEAARDTGFCGGVTDAKGFLAEICAEGCL